MQTIRQACTPRASAIERARQDTTLDLTDLLQDRIAPEAFFRENYLTRGMQTLLQGSFQRFAGLSTNSTYLLKQSMGGGKTHSMITLGLLAKHPKYRSQLLGNSYNYDLGAIRVVGFTGRESDAPLGIWGEIATQIGNKDLLKDYYSPLQAPGQTAWINLLQGAPLLILLDELPPYFTSAKSKGIGNSDLSVVTQTALANLLVAVGKAELSNVCVVISDLSATYEDGSEQINKALQTFASECDRSVIKLEPVGMNTNEIYHILRQKIFAQLPTTETIKQVAQGYASSVKYAKQMDITNASPTQIANSIEESYPFHYGIRDLYARFKENPNFQQTRGLIRFMRAITANLFADGGKADTQFLIHAHDIDLNDEWVLQEISNINPALTNAISHDIASHGSAIAEIMDSNRGGTDAQDVCKLLLVSSLANVPNAIVGLSLPEIISYLCAPSRQLDKLPTEILGNLLTKAWYLHTTTDNKIYFKNVENLVAKLSTYTTNFYGEPAKRELIKFLTTTFTPSSTSPKDCYQSVMVFPAIDEIQLIQDKITLVITAPHPNGINPELRSYYDQLDYKNRIFFLTGDRANMDGLMEKGAELKAIHQIISEMRGDKRPDNDPQMVSAKELEDKIVLSLLSATRETFSTLYYPSGEGLTAADFMMNFPDNQYNGEQQIRETLKAKQKFTEDISSSTFRAKCETRLLTQKIMPWSEVKRRAACLPVWQWHRPDALDALKAESVSKDLWREQGNMVEKPPFPAPETGVQVSQLQRNDDTGEVILRLATIFGDTIHYEIGAKATPSSLIVEDPKQFRTTELQVSFLCVDSTGKHQTGADYLWSNTLTIKSREYQQVHDKMCELQAAPPAPIRYTTDGSDPRLNGGIYDAPFVVPKGTVLVLAIAEKNGIVSKKHERKISSDPLKVDVDLHKPAVLKRRQNSNAKQDSFKMIDTIKKFEAKVYGLRIEIHQDDNTWLDFSTSEGFAITAEQIEAIIQSLRHILPSAEVKIESEGLEFTSGQKLVDWVADQRTELRPDEVKQ